MGTLKNNTSSVLFNFNHISACTVSNFFFPFLKCYSLYAFLRIWYGTVTLDVTSVYIVTVIDTYVTVRVTYQDSAQQAGM